MKYYRPEVVSVGGWLKICPWVASRVADSTHRTRFGADTDEMWYYTCGDRWTRYYYICAVGINMCRDR